MTLAVLSFVLVSNCLDVIMRCIDSSASIELIGRYYFMLNESTCQSFCQWKIFMDNTLLLMGFPELVRKSIVEVTSYFHCVRSRRLMF